MKYSDKIIASHIVKAAAALSHKWWGGDVQFYDTAANGISNGDLPKNPFCRFIQSLDDGKTRCQQNCRKQLRNACDDKKPFVFRCYAGLYGIVAPVHTTGKHVGSLLCSGIHKPEQQKSFERVEIRKLTQLGFSKEEILHHWSLLKKINSHSEEYIIDFYDYVAKDIALLYEKAMAEKEYIINAVSLSERSFGGV